MRRNSRPSRNWRSGIIKRRLRKAIPAIWNLRDFSMRRRLLWPSLRAMKPLSECLLYTFIDTAYLKGREPEEVARQLCDGGSDLIQLRAKKSAIDEIRALAELIVPITHEAKVGFVIN